MRVRTIIRHSTILVILANTFAFTGCLTTWNTTVGPQRSATLGITADLPDGWARFNPDHDLAMTRDGFLLQSIRVTRQAYGTKIENTDRNLSAGLEAHDAAQILIDSMGADQSRHQLAIIDNRPATVAGFDGIRLEVTYRTPEGLKMHEVQYVALAADSYIVARFSAPERHYFERGSGDFEKVVASMKIEEPAPKGVKRS